MVASVTGAIAGTDNSGTIAVSGGFGVVVSMTTGTQPTPLTISDTLGSAWTGVLGAIGTSSCYEKVGPLFMSAWYANYSTKVGPGINASNSVSMTFAGSPQPSTRIVMYADCAGIDLTAPVVCNIAASQSVSVGLQANSISANPGGTGIGSDNITVAPALVVAFTHVGSGPMSAGTSPNAFTTNYNSGNASLGALIESFLTNSPGVLDATAGSNASANTLANMWQIVLKQAAAAAAAVNPFMPYGLQPRLAS